MTLYNVGLDPAQPTQIVFSAAVRPGGRSVAEMLVTNRDPQIPILIAFDLPHQQPDFTGPRVSIVDPNSSTVVNGTVDAYALAAPGYQVQPAGTPGTVQVDVVPTALGTSGNPLAIATAIVVSGLAAQIAQQIAVTGISLVPSPQLLYQLGLSPSGSGAKMGVTVPPGALQPGCYAAGQTQSGADTTCVTAVNRPTGKTHPTVTKKFWQVSDWRQLPYNDMATYQANGTKVVVCLQPVVTTGLPAGSDFTLVGTTAQKNAAIADKAALAAFLAYLAGLGFTATTCDIVLWQEPGDPGKLTATPADYGNMWLTYGPTVNAAHGGITFPAIMNVNFVGTTSINKATDYLNAGLGLRGNPATGTTFAGVAMDWYVDSYRGGLFLGSPDSNGDTVLSITAAAGLDLSLNEIGCKVATPHPTVAECTSYLTGDPVNSVLAVTTAWLNAGRNLRNVIYYEGNCTADGSGQLSSPILTGTDFRVPLYQQIYDAVTATALTGTTINANSTKTIAPSNPSSAGNFAAANQLGYEIVVSLSAGAASTNPFADIILSFFDFDVTGAAQVVTDQVQFRVPMGANGDAAGGTVTIGLGRLRGAFMTLKISNLDSVAATINYLQLAGVGRTYDRDYWKYDCSASTSPQVPGFTLASAAAQSLQIGRVTGQTVLHGGGSKSWLCGMYAGQVTVRFAVVSGSTGNNVNFKLQPQPTSVFSTQSLLNETIGAAGNTEFLPPGTVALPRAPCLVVVTNNEAAADVTVDFEIIAVET